jgi:hypothetical protein
LNSPLREIEMHSDGLCHEVRQALCQTNIFGNDNS